MPGICFACHSQLPEDVDDFCSACAERITNDPSNSCPRCSGTVGPFAEVENGCAKCRNEHYAFDRAFRLGPYDGLLRELILQMKRPGSESLAEAVGRRWAADSETTLRAMGVDLIAPIPLHWTRRWKRGFNQSEILAREWARKLRIPVRSNWQCRVRATPVQTSLSPTGRRENVKGVFKVSRKADVRGRTILLIDDVMTTGSTLSESAKAWRRAGAKSVIAAVLAHDH